MLPKDKVQTKHPASPGPSPNSAQPWSLLTDDDLYLFNAGDHFRLYEKLGAHLVTANGVEGVFFAVWAPNAKEVHVIGQFNAWKKGTNQLASRGSSGIWEGFVPGVKYAMPYKYHIVSRHNSYQVDKADPFAFHAETSPKTASITWPLDYQWGDGEWMRHRKDTNSLHAPMSIYEVHLGSWRRKVEEGNRSLNYREMAPLLADYATQMGFTHVEMMPVMEHPFYGSWGYQVTGFFAPTSRYGTPQDFMYLVDYLHQRDIGVILDWVPSHFPSDEHGLAYFDGTHLYEHMDMRQGFHPEWNSYIFNYGRHEVRSFLISSAIFWLDKCHVDGLRVDGVASMLYLDYARKAGEWVPNEHGGKENIPAIAFLRRLNEEVYRTFPDVQTIAEESTAWSMVSRPTYLGGLGFGLKWDMGWMHDTLDYMSKDPVHRRHHHYGLIFRMAYAFTENFVLSLSHDEVVHGKGSLAAKMPGDDWQKLANLRLLYGYLFGQPGKKLLFMGSEFGQWTEWDHDKSLDWHLLQQPSHEGVQRLFRDLNKLYRERKALHELDTQPAGFEWIDCNDAETSVLSMMRRDRSGREDVIIVCNFTPIPRHNYLVGAPHGGFWREVLNTDSRDYGGSGLGNFGGVRAAPVGVHGRPFALNLTLPPLAAVFLAP